MAEDRGTPRRRGPLRRLLLALPLTALVLPLFMVVTSAPASAAPCVTPNNVTYFPGSVYPPHLRYGAIRINTLACDTQAPSAWSVTTTNWENGTGKMFLLQIESVVRWGGIGATARHFYVDSWMNQCIKFLCGRVAHWTYEFYIHKVNGHASLVIYLREHSDATSGYTLYTTG